MVYDDLLERYIDKDGNVVECVPVVDVDDGKNFNEEFNEVEVLGKDVIFKEQQERAISIEKTITNFKNQIKILEEQKKAINDKILKEMQNNDIWKLQVGDVTITRKKAHERHGIDTDKLKSEMPDIAKLYDKVTNVGESIVIKTGGTNNEV